MYGTVSQKCLSSRQMYKRNGAQHLFSLAKLTSPELILITSILKERYESSKLYVSKCRPKPLTHTKSLQWLHGELGRGPIKLCIGTG